MEKKLVILAKSWPMDSHGGSIAVTSTLKQYVKFFDSIQFICLEEKDCNEGLPQVFPTVSFHWVPIKKGGFLKRFLISLAKNQPAITIGLESSTVFKSIKKHISKSGLTKNDSFVGIVEDNVPVVHLTSLKRNFPNSTWAFHSHDVLHKAFEIFKTIGNPIKRWVWKFELGRIYRFEKNAALSADVYWTITEDDLKLSSKQFGKQPNGYIDSDIDLDRYSSVKQGDPYTLLYLGSADIRKSHGLNSFINEVWKPVRKTFGTRVRFLIGGKNTEVFNNPNLGIIGKGFIDDEIEFLSQGHLFINPQIAGSGLKLKSLIAMAAGKVLITTSNGALGLNGEPNKHYIVCANYSQMSKAIHGLIEITENQQAISSSGLNHMHSNFSESAFSERVRPLLTELWTIHKNRIE